MKHQKERTKATTTSSSCHNEIGCGQLTPHECDTGNIYWPTTNLPSLAGQES